MTDEQRKRIHDITYSTEDREELAERIVALEDKRDKLRRERDLYSPLVEDMDHPDTANQLRVENAKLRELARHMGACIQHLDRTDEDGGCARCPYQTVEYDCGFEQRMAELGIEVDV